MERTGAAGVPEVMGRYLAIDESGTGLRATWRPAHGFTNVSLWRGDVCVETYHLSAHQMGELIAFLGTSLAAASPAPTPLRVVPPAEDSAGDRPSARAALRTTREATARLLDAAASRVRPSRRR